MDEQSPFRSFGAAYRRRSRHPRDSDLSEEHPRDPDDSRENTPASPSELNPLNKNQIMTFETGDISTILHQNFPQIAERELQAEVAEVGQLMHFRAGEVIMDYGSYIKMVPLIIKGSIRVTKEDDFDGKEILLYFLSAGDTCSMSFSCCMMNKKSMIRTEAVEDTTMIGIPIKYVDQWMSKYQSWKNFVMLSYDNRLIELVKVIDSIAFNNMDQRLQDYLNARKEATGNALIEATHQEIANDLNASREAISRLLKKMENLGKVELGRNQVRLLS